MTSSVLICDKLVHINGVSQDYLCKEPLDQYQGWGWRLHQTVAVEMRAGG